MTVAQKLYETGFITYMRTDSLNLAQKFLNETQTFISNNYGADYAKGAVAYKTGKKDAQEAHEAIRPTDVNKHPDLVKAELEAGQWKLYNLIWRRTVATQLPPAKLERTGIDLKANDYTFRANGSIVVFDGFMKVYKASKEKILPEVKEGDEVNAQSITPIQHFTEPPARYSDATLVKVLEEHGIGRPSTYAPTIGTIIARGYVDRDDNKKLFPTDIAGIVTDMLIAHFPKIVDYEFTAEMENSLDEIAEGKIEWAPMLDAFYKPFIATIEEKDKTLTREEIMPDRILGNDPETGLPIHVRTGRYGAYVQLGEWSEEDRKAKLNKPKSVSLSRDLQMESITLEEGLALLALPKVVGKTKDGIDITVQIGPFGPYLKGGDVNITLPKEYSPIKLDDVDVGALFDEAAAIKKKMMTPIAELGEDPNSKGQIQIKLGRYGHYVTDGETNASIKKDIDPLAVTREEAIEILEKKRKAPKRNWGKKKTAAKPKAKTTKKKATKKKASKSKS
jgi:DNA topoisomerase-1